LYAALFVCSILITVFIYLKWQAVSGISLSLSEMTEKWGSESDAANWFTYATYIVLCLQLLAIVMWIVTFTKPSPVIPLLAGGVTFIGAFAFLIMAIFGLGTVFSRNLGYTNTATAIPYLTLLLSAGEVVCALYAPKLLVPVLGEPVKSVKSDSQGKIVRSGDESSKKLLDELDGTVAHDDNKPNSAKHSGK